MGKTQPDGTGVQRPGGAVGQGRAVEPRPDGDAPPAQGLPRRLAVHAVNPEGEHAGLGRRLLRLKHRDTGNPGQCLPRRTEQPALMGQDALRPLGPDVAEALQQSGDARHVVGARLQPVRQEIRHFRRGGIAPRPPGNQRLRQDAAQQQAGALGAVKALVAGHGDIGRSQLPQGDRNASGGLGRIQDEGDAALPAQRRHRLRRQHIAEHIGHMAADHRGNRFIQRLSERLHHLGRTKQRRPGHPHLHLRDRGQGAGNRVVLIAGNDHRAARLHQTADGDVQAVGCAGRENHLFRRLHVKQAGSQLPAGERRPGRLHGGRVASAPRACQGVHRLRHGLGHGRRLLQGGGRAVQIDHSFTSR